ncbi:hypothetical protein OPU71_11315 [Niveibacterium sp. 24ML]|uniref:ABC-type transport auxiliary lipoprotein family protein n=1 Tax=Niveibacterium sp. 24ML TaxID=2985512 RepID=UPI002270C131|nr:hypothetical protein [Niveibacterium sp. 24ML]MCX9156713.1 hypothetical protein [Niveibacterium sp. 24ML]
MRTPSPILFVAIFLLAACVSRGPSGAAPTQHDLGLPPVAGSAQTKLALRRVEVIAAPVLSGLAMQYRYEGEQSTRRLSYADNRWSATPQQLLEAHLSRMLIADGKGGHCKLQVRLDEFVQIFAQNGSSVGYAAGSFRLLADRADEVLAQQAFVLKRPAPSADAAGGALALREVSASMAAEAARWLDTTDLRRCTAS